MTDQKATSFKTQVFFHTAQSDIIATLLLFKKKVSLDNSTFLRDQTKRKHTQRVMGKIVDISSVIMYIEKALTER